MLANLKKHLDTGDIRVMTTVDGASYLIRRSHDGRLRTRLRPARGGRVPNELKRLAYTIYRDMISR